MKIIDSLSALEGVKKGCVLSIGNFDGVHLGHQLLLGKARDIADERNTDLMIMTFDPHPLAFLYPEKAPGLLTPLALKKHLLEQNGVDWRLAIKCSQEILSMSPEKFIEHFLVNAVRPSCLVEGADFNFGAGRSGDVELLKRLSADCGFDVVVVPSKKIDIPGDEILKVSSTMIRYMLQGGSVADAAMALGRPYRLVGSVVKGRGKGRELGFPTINLGVGKQVMPAEGVYAGRVCIGKSETEVSLAGAELPAVFSIGQARTFGHDFPLLIEAHVLGRKITVEPGHWMAMDFVDHIRTQHKFASEDDLKSQIQEDCQAAMKILAEQK